MTITTGSFPKQLEGRTMKMKTNKKYPVSKMNRAKAKRLTKPKAIKKMKVYKKNKKK